jgi:DNA-directed RNA polymerase subunit M/transcription elongation factor TFIIS
MMDLSNKSLGNEGDVPQFCPACNAPMCDKGWQKYGCSLACRACGNIIKIVQSGTTVSWEV